MVEPLLAIEKNGNLHAMTITEFLDELTYANYKHNRGRAPDITPERWKTTYANVDAMEARYQRETHGR